jgi:hypothetical protein
MDMTKHDEAGFILGARLGRVIFVLFAFWGKAFRRPARLNFDTPTSAFALGLHGALSNWKPSF